MDKPIYVVLALLELSKLHMYESNYDKLQPFFVEKGLQLHYMDTDRFVLRVHTKNSIKHLKNLGDFFDFINLGENHELFSNKNIEIFG